MLCNHNALFTHELYYFFGQKKIGTLNIHVLRSYIAVTVEHPNTECCIMSTASAIIQYLYMINKTKYLHTCLNYRFQIESSPSL